LLPAFCCLAAFSEEIARRHVVMGKKHGPIKVVVLGIDTPEKEAALRAACTRFVARLAVAAYWAEQRREAEAKGGESGGRDRP
jgi:hypothetical protein